jgi:hypothetical protein
VREDACGKLFATARPPGGAAPTDTLTTAEAIARHPWHRPDKLLALLDAFYPQPKGARIRKVPFLPYLTFPSSLNARADLCGGGLNSLGGIAIDAEGNAREADNDKGQFSQRSERNIELAKNLAADDR